MAIDLDDKRKAILSEPGHIIIEGGPGSGKTTVALLKALERISTLEDEEKILFLSFSRAAVRQITERMSGLFTPTARKTIEVRTFHAFFLDILRSHGRLITGKPVSIVTPERESLRRAGHDGDWHLECERMARQESSFVFDTFAPFTAELLESSGDILELYSARYPLVIVDEFQDTSRDQWRVIEQLARRSAITCLADPDQRIYGHLEGVDEHRIENARTSLAARTFDLSADNYRSPSAGMLEYGNAILTNTAAQPPRSLTTWTYRSERVEAMTHQAVATLQQTYTAQGGSGMPTIAVLTRTNALAARISDALGKEETLNNGASLSPVEHVLEWDPELTAMSALVVASILEWSSKEDSVAVKDTLQRIADFFRTKLARGNKGAKPVILAVERAINAIETSRTPASNTGKALLEHSSRPLLLTGNPVRDWQEARKILAGSKELAEVLKQSRLIRMLRSTDSLSWSLLDAWDGVGSYVNAAEVVRVTLAEQSIDASLQATPAVSVMTMHKSKGKEFDAIVLVEGRYGRDPFLSPDASSHEADRRLLRMAITRPRHVAILVRPFDAPNLTPPAQVAPSERG